jgi:hypothetical protein
MSEDARAGLRAAVEAHVCGYCHNRISYTPENDQWPIYQSKPCRTGGCAPLRAALAAAPVAEAGEVERLQAQVLHLKRQHQTLLEEGAHLCDEITGLGAATNQPTEYVSRYERRSASYRRTAETVQQDINRAALAAAPVQGARGEGDRWPTDGETPATCPVCGIEWDSTDLRRHPRKPLPWWRCSDCGAEWNEIDRKAAAGR